MTTPPPGENPYYPPRPPSSRIAVGMVFVGAPVYVVINVVIGFTAFIFAGSTTNQNANWVFGIAALVLAFVAFGAGGGLLAAPNRNAKGFGLGLMVGWALTSIFTVGICTGLNPGVYTL
jgi:membrane-bound ClpP family serine protease